MSENAVFACRKDGSEFLAEISLSPIETEQGTLVSAAIRDVTSRQEIERSLQSNVEIQSALVSLLELALEPLSLEEHLGRTLDLLFSIPSVGIEPRGAIYLLENDPRVLVMKAQRGLPDSLCAECERVPFGTCLCGEAAATRRLVFTNCVDERHERCFPNMLPHGHYCVPMVTGGDLLGVVNLYVREGHVQKPQEDMFFAAAARVLARIVKRKQTEDALRKSEERFQLACEGAEGGIWDWDLLTNRVYYSSQWKRILGYQENEIRHDYFEWESLLHPDDRERALATVRDYLAGETSGYELEHRLRHKDGSYRWILARGAAVRDKDGNPYRLVGSHLDITERKRSEQLQREREGQLVAAQRIQEHILPRSAPDVPGFDIAGSLIPSEFAAGDYFDYLWMPDGSMGIVVGDVSGHGFSSALLMATTSAHLRSYIEEHSDVEEILTHINAILCREVEEGRFVTFFLGRLEITSRTLHYVNAGHPSGYVIDASGEIKATLDSSTFPLAILPESEFEVSGPVALEPNDVVLLTTDGILEAQSATHELFGKERMLEVVKANRHKKASEIIDNLQQAVSDFTECHEHVDDLTTVVVKVVSLRRRSR
jgi:PAS domain S-box-containing protein